ncbi:hypothetical protein LL266_16770 [Vibrio anguillarum]|uniref:hypothetical protein n=1 Tax=Vibrio anguillarum TaxID=55601 RepID=UPI001D1840E3|nr:hypothetical protein [Vibrio anguillarum]MCC4238144.1 hypothetical protein [Vibrio anguillarum]
MQFAAPALTGFCSGFGAVVALKVDVRWLKNLTEQLGEKLDNLSERVSRMEGRG